MINLTTLISLSLLCMVQSYNLLVYYPLPVRSINIFGGSIVKTLLNAGHEVTFISSYPLNLKHKRLRQIDISGNVENFENDATYNVGFIIENSVNNKVTNDFYDYQLIGAENSREALANVEVTRLLQDPNEKFDAVLVDLFESEVYLGLAALYDCPLIWVYSMGAHWHVLRMVSEPTNPAYDPDFLSTNSIPLNFFERAEELYIRIRWYFRKIFITKPIEKETYKNTFTPLLEKRGKSLPAYEDIMYNASFMFCNEHHAISMRPSTPQNFKYIGGVHIENPTPPLPKDLQEIMDKSSNGVIYFSLGTLFKSKGIPQSLVREILDVFAELKQTVIWKFEAVLNDLPKNVHIVKWAPQQSILAHPNLKLFISHGGLFSLIEVVHFGVPVIGVPVLFDQFYNVVRAAREGYAIHVNLDYDMAKNFKKSINIILNDDRYKNRVKQLSEIYHDTPVKAKQELVHWVNHVIKTRGALHLRSPALQVPFYQRLYIDLAAVILVILISLFLLLRKIYCFVFSETKSIKQKIN